MTVYLYMHPVDHASERQTLLRLDALRGLRDELSALAGVRVYATPQAADLEVVVVNVVANDGPDNIGSETGPRILVVRMTRNGERLDFVCSDGLGDRSAERQAARRIRNWVAGEDFLTMTRATHLSHGTGARA